MNLLIPNPLTRSSVTRRSWKAASLLLLACLAPAALLSEPRSPRQPRILHVVGRGEAVLPVTVAQLRFAVHGKGKTAVESQGDLRRRTAEIHALLKNGGASLVEVTPVRLGRHGADSKMFSSEPTEVFAAAALIECRSTIELAGPLADAALRDGLAYLTSVEFTASDEELKQARQAALLAAVADARAQANTVLGALGSKTEETVSADVQHKIDASEEKAGTGRSTVRATVEMDVRY